MGHVQTFLLNLVELYSGCEIARFIGGMPGAQLELGLTKTVVITARQLSRSLVGIYH